MVGAMRFALCSRVGNAARSATLAAVTTATTRTPPESTSTCRLTPSTFFAPSNPRGPATGDALTLEESTTAAVGRLRRPERVRTSPRAAVRIRAHVPLRHQRRKCLCAADHDTVKSCGRCHHAHPVRSTYKMASRYSRHRCGGQGRPPLECFETRKRAMRAHAVSDRSERYRRRRSGFGSHDHESSSRVPTRLQWPACLSVRHETLNGDGAAHHIPVLSRPDGRAA